MTLPTVVAALLVLAVVLGVHGARRRGAAWRSPRVWLQPLSALAFHLLLFPPALPVAADTLTVLTPQVARPWWSGLVPLHPVVALPGAQVSASIEHVPDLATALRQHPQTRTLAIVGDGLPPRDREAVDDRGLRFAPAAEHGLLELQLPARVLLGTQWSASGRVAATPAPHAVTQIELHDPAGAIVDAVRPDAAGRFAVSGLAKVAGPARFELRLLDTKSTVIETASVPVIAQPGAPLRVILRVGAPDAEFKYWRRWAVDAGIVLALRAGLSDKVELREGDTTLTSAALAQTDLVVLDERAWATLDAGEKGALTAAVRDGLGLLLRIGGPVDAPVAADWSTLGVTVQPADSHGVTLDRRTGLRDRERFTVAPATATLDLAVPLLTADDGESLAGWHAEGRGRIGVWRLLDSYRLGLLGEGARYGALWSQTLAALSRPQPRAAELRVPAESWIDERLPLCGLGHAAALIAPDGARSELPVDDAGCAPLWPAQAGWHVLQAGSATAAFYVRAADDAAGLRATRDRRETARQVREPAAAPVVPPAVPTRLPRWPWLLLWLGVVTALWWQERPDAPRPR